MPAWCGWLRRILTLQGQPIPRDNPCGYFFFPDLEGEDMPFQFFQRHGAHKSRFSGSLNGQHWRFLRSNLDYSREAFPLSGESILTQPEKRPSRLLLSEKPKNLLRASQRSRKRLSEPQSYTSKLSLMSQTQKNHVAQVEYCLSQHPLALYPNFEESIPAEVRTCISAHGFLFFYKSLSIVVTVVTFEH